MKFLNEQDRQLFEWNVKQAGSEDKFIQRRQGIVSQLKDFHKGTQAKSGWKKNRWKHLVAIKRFHKSTIGKRFHRALGRFLSNRYLRDKTSSQQRENYDFIMALTSAITHSMLETQYYFPSIVESAEYEFFVDYITEEIGKILISLENETFDFNEHEEFLLRLCESIALLQSFADKTGKPIQEIETAWEKAKQIAKEQGKDEQDDGFYAYVVGILKQSLGGV